MLRKIIGAAVAATAVTAAVVVTVVTKKKKNEEEVEDEQVHFINIEDVSDTEENEEVEEKKEEVEEVSDEVKEVASIYPYLSTSFVAEQFARNDVFNEKYPEDTLVTISHKARFSHLDEKEQFCSIAKENEYEVEELTEKEVLVKKKMYSTDGAILSDIYNVANQVNCLNGTYEGYQID